MSKMLLAVAIVVLGAWTCWAQELAMVREEGFVRSLNGQWEFAPEGSNVFDKVPVPGNWSKSTQVGDWKQASALRGGTYRRSFDVPSGVTGVALEFDAIRWGGEVLVNGKVVGKGILGNSPLWADASAAVKEGPNVLEVRPRGWPALERFQTGDVQIPSGAAQWFGSKMGGIPEDAWVRFYRGARVGTVRVTPRFAGPSCGIAVEVMAPSTAFKGKLCARILSDDGSKAYSQVARQEVDLVAGQTVEVTLKDVAAREAPLWSIEAPQMCRATVWLEADGQKEPASVREESFGFREITIRDGHVQINGRRVALHGFTGGIWPYDAFISRGADDDFKKWQVTLFRAMHGRAFRCHMEPMPREWLDLCDRNGILVIPEFPNFPDIQRQPNWSLESPYDRRQLLDAFSEHEELQRPGVFLHTLLLVALGGAASGTGGAVAGFTSVWPHQIVPDGDAIFAWCAGDGRTRRNVCPRGADLISNRTGRQHGGATPADGLHKKSFMGRCKRMVRGRPGSQRGHQPRRLLHAELPHQRRFDLEDLRGENAEGTEDGDGVEFVRHAGCARPHDLRLPMERAACYQG